MIKKDKNYRLSKSVKRMMAGKFCLNPNAFKKTMIEGEIVGSVVVSRPSKKQKFAEKTEE